MCSHAHSKDGGWRRSIVRRPQQLALYHGDWKVHCRQQRHSDLLVTLAYQHNRLTS